MITTVFFDIGNVLAGYDHNLIWQRLASFSVLSPEALQEQIQASGLMHQHETGELPPAEFFVEVGKRGKLLPSCAYKTFVRFWADIFWEQRPVIRLAAHVQKQYTIGLLSNVGEIHWNWLIQRFPIFLQVPDDMRILSFQVGSLKPSEQIYQEAIERSRSEPEQCLYIDDLDVNVKAGQELGMQAIRYQSPEQLEQELQQLQVIHFPCL